MIHKQPDLMVQLEKRLVMVEVMRSKQWHEETDVVVIGSGFAGLSAAIEAKWAGASVLILEKMKSRGGNSIISDGCVAAAGSSRQKKEGVKDSPELLYEDMLRAGLGLNHPELARIVAERSAEVFEWTVDVFGVRYKEGLSQFGGHSVPRTHIPLNNSGAALLRPMLAKAERLGMEVRTRAYFKSFIKNEDGSLAGVRILDGYTFAHPEGGIEKCIQARKAVILATGGFGNDVPFRTVQDPRLSREVDTTNHRGATAEAMTEALRLGAAPVQLSWIQLGPWTCPDEKGYGVGPQFAGYAAFPYGLMIHPRTGRRFINELSDRKQRADAILDLGSPCIAVVDAQGVEAVEQAMERCLKRGVVKRFHDLEELARAYDLPTDALLETVDEFNSFVIAGEDSRFHKPILTGAKPLTHPPYFAMRLWPKVHYTMGGLRIDNRARVIDLDHRPIRKLYAAGEVVGGVHGACRLGSVAIPECFVFGRIAGQNAAAE